MRNQTFIFALLTALILVSNVQAKLCPDFICGKRDFGAVRQLYGYREVTTKQLRKLLEVEQPIVILDARTEDQDDGRRLPNAIRLPHNTPDDEIEALQTPKDTLIVIYCTNRKSLSSRYLAETMVRLGYTRVLKYTSGLEGWTKPTKAVASVDRNN